MLAWPLCRAFEKNTWNPLAVHFTLKLIEQIKRENGLSCGKARTASRGCRLRDQIEKGFTLVEIIVVVAIISILAALMLPVIGRVMDKARMSKCVAQLRTIGQGLSMYSGERDMRFPGLGMGGSARWIHQIAPYIGFKADKTYGGVPCFTGAYDEPLFKCPMVGRWILPSGKDPQLFYGRYGLNRLLYDDSANQSQDSAMIGYSRMIVQRPAQTVMVSESCIGGPGAAASSYPDQRQDTGVSANHRPDRTPSNGPDGPSNYLFVDGHVETRTKFIGAAAFNPAQ
jgi:prepilin-type N-terminal cleavage/methylation domain-containing protein/prepilin-type processing-associated H-X9-DG protein